MVFYLFEVWFLFANNFSHNWHHLLSEIVRSLPIEIVGDGKNFDQLFSMFDGMSLEKLEHFVKNPLEGIVDNHIIGMYLMKFFICNVNWFHKKKISFLRSVRTTNLISWKRESERIKKYSSLYWRKWSNQRNTKTF